MSLLNVKVPDSILNRLRSMAEEQDVSLDALVETALSHFLYEDEEMSKEEILETIRESLKAVRKGKGQDALEMIAELRQELLNDAD